MGRSKEPNEGTVPCLVCLNRFSYLTSNHLQSENCKTGSPTDIDAYRAWVAAEFDVDVDDPIFDENQLQKPQHYRKHAERLDLPR